MPSQFTIIVREVYDRTHPGGGGARGFLFAQKAVKNQDVGYIREMINRMPEAGARYLVQFCRLVCETDDEKGENDG